MKISGWIGSIGLLLAIAGYGQNQASNQVAPTTTVAVTSPSVAVSPAAPSAAQASTAAIAVPPAPPILAVPDLIPPTSAAARVSQINAGRSNPYANVATTPRVAVSPATSPRAAASTIPARPAAPARSSSPSTPSSPTVARSNPPSNPSSIAPAVRPASNSPQPQAISPRPTAETRPTAEIARSIAVSGVVQTSDRTSAIVQIPQEGSRYVSVGDRLAGGRVLVKRIEVGASDEAIVVFEQDGVEISRSVGASGVL